MDEYQQAASYDVGLRLAFCQPTVAGVLLFHSQDETALLSWQSGLYYADGTPKASLPGVRDSLDRTRGGSIARCDGLALDVRLTNVRFPGPKEFASGKRDTHFRCTLDCTWELRATRTTTGAVAATVRGYARYGRDDRRVADRPSARSSARAPAADGHPGGQPGCVGDAPERRAPHILTPRGTGTAYDSGMGDRPEYERIEGVEVGQYVGYRFFRIDPAWRRLPIDERLAGKDAFADVIDEYAGRMEGLRAYVTTGVRPEADFFLWSITQRYDDLLELGAALNGTPLAGWLTTPHSYLGTTKPSVYTDKKRVRQGRVAPRNAPYLVVYPFVKRRPWYFLSFEERAAAMRQHAEIGGKFVTVTNHTTYSFGIDDQEFIPAFEAEEPADFMHLMMTLRETEASRWTEQDTPIFVGKLVDVRTALDALDGAVTELPSADALYTAPDGTRYPSPTS